MENTNNNNNNNTFLTRDLATRLPPNNISNRMELLNS